MSEASSVADYWIRHLRAPNGLGDAFKILDEFMREDKRSRLRELRNLALELALRGYISWDEFKIIDRMVREKLKEGGMR